MYRVFLITFSHITFPFHGSVRNRDSSQFHVLYASNCGYSLNSCYANVIKHTLALETLTTPFSFMQLIITM